MKMQRKRNILVVDDDEFNLMILIKNAKAAGYEVKPFDSGDLAWDYLQLHGDEIDIAVLDKMMPGLNGLELLKRIKSTENLKRMPVIMQTGDVGTAQMCEGLNNGAYYYLTKPFAPEVLCAILHAAENECLLRDELVAHVENSYGKIGLILQEGEFVIRTHAEARFLIAALSQCVPRSDSVSRGLMELISNAIEHGNLDIGYQAKRNALLSGQWWQELDSRASDAIYGNRRVHVKVEKMFSVLHVNIRDEGKGFNWQHYMKESQSADILTRVNGRGMFTAIGVLDDVRYIDNGNEVQCNISMNSAITGMHGNESEILHPAIR
jgi:CheY-like chemotaxis protein